MAHGDFKDLTRRTAFDKILHDRACNISNNPKYDGHQRGFTSMVYNFFDKKSSGSGVKSKIMPNQELVEELQKLIIRKFEKRKVYSPFKDDIGGTDLAITN